MAFSSSGVSPLFPMIKAAGLGNSDFGQQLFANASFSVALMILMVSHRTLASRVL
jgi:hypothetical protein